MLEIAEFKRYVPMTNRLTQGTSGNKIQRLIKLQALIVNERPLDVPRIDPRRGNIVATSSSR